MKKILLLLLCLLLCGCSNAASLTSDLDKIFTESEEKPVIRKNNYSTYIDYYLPSDTTELEGDELSSVLSYNKSLFIMDVNVSGIICAKYYPDNVIEDEGFFNDEKLVYEKRSSFLNGDGENIDYVYKVYEYDNDYLSYFVSRDLIFYAHALKGDIAAVSSRIYLMAKGAKVKSSDVIAKYSSKDVIDYEKKQVNLFETIMPVNGNINDFLIGSNSETPAE